MSTKIALGGLKVDEQLAKLVAEEIAPGTGIDPQKFWTALGGIVKELGPRCWFV
jgi:malate synthase